MPWYDKITGTQRPVAGTFAVSASRLRAELLELNSPDNPWIVRDGAPEQLDLVAEWKHEESDWGPVTVVRGYTHFETLMRFDENARVVNAIDREWEVVHTEGQPRPVGASRSYSQGNLNSNISTYAHDEMGNPVRYQFNTNNLKNPLRDTVTAAGWTWRYRMRIP